MPTDADVLLLSTFTADLVHAAMADALRRRGVPLSVAQGPYGQVPEVLASLARDDREGAGSPVAVAVVVRPADLFRVDRDPDPEYLDASDEVLRRADGWSAALCDGLADVRALGTTVVLVVLDVPAPRLPAAAARWCSAAARWWREEARAVGVTVVDADAPEPDPYLDLLAHVPIDAASASDVGIRLARAVRSRIGPPVKVVALDCDDTLWGGSCAELGPGGVDHDGPYDHVQRWAIEQRAAGRPVCLASHNDPDDVDRTLAGRGPLGAEHVTDRRVSWASKAVMVRELADALAAAPETVLFVDNDPVRREEVRRALPEVRVPEFATPHELADLLTDLWLDDGAVPTPEDRRRAARHADEARRVSLHGPARSERDFVESLGVRVLARPLRGDMLDRAAQMFSRITQFRLVRSTTGPGAVQAAPDGGAWVLEVEDDIGDYGRVGLLVTRLDGRTLSVDTLLLSCRVLGRGVEACAAQLIRDEARARGADVVEMSMTPTKRSAPAEAFLRALASRVETAAPDDLLARIAVPDLDPTAAGPLATLTRADGTSAGATNTEEAAR